MATTIQLIVFSGRPMDGIDQYRLFGGFVMSEETAHLAFAATWFFIGVIFSIGVYSVNCFVKANSWSREEINEMLKERRRE